VPKPGKNDKTNEVGWVISGLVGELADW